MRMTPYGGDIEKCAALSEKFCFVCAMIVRNSSSRSSVSYMVYDGVKDLSKRSVMGEAMSDADRDGGG